MDYLELAKDIVALQHFGRVDLIVKPEPLCIDCGTILTENEEEHCNDLCFDCFEKVSARVHEDSRHPDERR